MTLTRIALLLALALPATASPRLWVLQSPADVSLPTASDAGREAIRYWSAGAPNYRWNEVMFELFDSSSAEVVPERAAAALHIAINDAVVAADQHGRVAYARAAAAGAAGAVLAYLFPDKAAEIAGKADAAAHTLVLAGTATEADVAGALALGQAVGAKVVERLRNDGSDRPWKGSIPGTPGTWNGTNPLLPQIATWKPWILASPDALRPPPPPKFDAGAMKEVTDPANLAGSRKVAAYKWAITGLLRYFNEQAALRIFEDRLDGDPVRAAEIYSVLNAAYYDALIACWDAKYAYWGQRPNQFDPAFKSQITTPNFPGYPSGHAIFAGAATSVLAHYFPRDAKKLETMAVEIASSRLWGGVHFRVDNEVGLQMGRAIAALAIGGARR